MGLGKSVVEIANSVVEIAISYLSGFTLYYLVKYPKRVFMYLKPSNTGLSTI